MTNIGAFLPKVFLVLTFASLFGLIVIYDMYFYAYAWGELGRSPLSSLIIAIPALIALLCISQISL